jgi:hypothetical protein
VPSHRVSSPPRHCLLHLFLCPALFLIAGPIYQTFALSMSTKNKDRYIALPPRGGRRRQPSLPTTQLPKLNIRGGGIKSHSVVSPPSIAASRGDFHAYGGLATDNGIGLLQVDDNQRLNIWVGKAKASYGFGEVRRHASRRAPTLHPVPFWQPSRMLSRWRRRR